VDTTLWYILPVAALTTAVLAIISRLVLERSMKDCSTQFAADYVKNAKLLDVKDDEAPPAWTAAQTLLNTYVAINVHQVRMIFFSSMFVMVVGFCITCYGIMKLGTGGGSLLSSLPTIAGVLTEFIGGTFLLLYRSASRQSERYVGIIDRMNTVGMAVCVVRGIPERQDREKLLKAIAFATVARNVVGGGTDSPDGLFDWEKMLTAAGAVSNKENARP
jgi:nitrate reductase gamma subunit